MGSSRVDLFFTNPIDGTPEEPKEVPALTAELNVSRGDKEATGTTIGRLTSSLPSLARAEWDYIHRILELCDGNISKAASVLGLHRRSLQRKLGRLPPRK